MTRMGIPTTWWMGALLLAACGCKGTSASEPTGVETTSGGESAESAGTENGERAAAPTSPWGATRAEQCQRTALPPVAGKAQKAIDEGARAAASNDRAKARERSLASFFICGFLVGKLCFRGTTSPLRKGFANPESQSGTPDLGHFERFLARLTRPMELRPRGHNTLGR